MTCIHSRVPRDVDPEHPRVIAREKKTDIRKVNLPNVISSCCANTAMRVLIRCWLSRANPPRLAIKPASREGCNRVTRAAQSV